MRIGTARRHLCIFLDAAEATDPLSIHVLADSQHAQGSVWGPDTVPNCVQAMSHLPFGGASQCPTFSSSEASCRTFVLRKEWSW